MGGGRVTHFHTLLNLVNWNSANFYHIVTEVLPDFLVSAQVLRLYDGIPVAFRMAQKLRATRSLVNIWLGLINWELRKLNIHFIEGNHLFFAEKLVVPAHSFCGRPSGSVLKVRIDLPRLAPTGVEDHMTECFIACIASNVHHNVFELFY